MGSRVLANNMPRSDSIMTERMKAAGCIVIGKTNMPELGLGSHTFNTFARIITRFIIIKKGIHNG